ncbi:MAG: hypothetical protein PHI90_01315 [Clostridia bacterium]|nr:hypothetical protein [Clostridia bacterium]MDD4047464.1 hypothetical protein [Clostridia bacterium]
MIVVCKNHLKNTAISCHFSKLVLSKDFSLLCEELIELYKKYYVINPEQEAYRDAFYCLIAQEEGAQKGLKKSVSM